MQSQADTVTTTPDLLITAQAALQSRHDDLTTNVQRWGGITKEGGIVPHSYGCYAGMQASAYQDNAYMYLVFHGDGPEFTLEELADFEKQNEKVAATTRGHNQFEGTPRSLKWVQFLLSDQSPWRHLHQFLAVTDAETINKSGWLFKDMKKIPNKLLYNFAMAQRMLWENAPCAGMWYHLVDKGLHPAVALFIASNFCLSPGATSIDGPYSVYYPWSFLEGGGLDCARRFITGTPNPSTIKAGGDNTPNVLPLWACNDASKWGIKTDAIACRLDLSLGEIVTIVTEAVETQEV